jgi:hypothetical protein
MMEEAENVDDPGDLTPLEEGGATALGLADSGPWNENLFT